MSMLTIIKWLVYLWAISEGIMVSVMYWYAYQHMKKSKVIFWLAFLLTTVTIYFLYRFLTSYAIILTAKSHVIFRDALIIPIGIVAFAINRFKHVSVERVADEIETRN